MDDQYWLERWKTEDNPRFHQLSTNPDLQSFLDAFSFKTGDWALVPLCGKSLDLIYLLQSGFKVVGVELSKIAIELFFKENNISYELNNGIYKAKEHPLTIYHQNFFDFESDISFSFIYDRACLVALPYQDRKRYAQKILSLADNSFEIFLVAFEFSNKNFDDGPPFTVLEKEIRELYPSKKVYLLEDQTDDERIKKVYKIYS